MFYGVEGLTARVELKYHERALKQIPAPVRTDPTQSLAARGIRSDFTKLDLGADCPVASTGAIRSQWWRERCLQSEEARG